MQPYRARLKAATTQRGNLCVGIDPHAHLIEAWGQPLTVQGMENVARGLVEAVGDQVAVFKPQSAFFECWGSAGIAALERVLSDIAQAGALSILDAKRGDIGSTMEAYALAYLADGAALAADALTVSCFLGVGALRPAVDAAAANGRGLYVLCRTSNPEGADVQTARRGERSVAQYVVDSCQELNRRTHDALGVVIGATNTDLDVDLSSFNGSILVPGVGAQGGQISDLVRLFGDRAGNALPTTSREVMSAGPDRQALRDKVAQLVATVREELPA